MANISLNTNVSAAGFQSGTSSKANEDNGGLLSKVKKNQLEQQISTDEQKLRQLGTKETAEKAKISAELASYKSKLSELKQEDSGSLSEAEQKRRFDSFECQTCKNRRYQDESDDSGVSYQNATKIDPSAADSAVRSHENEHVARNRTEAEQNGQKIVYQTVSIKKGICPECGRVYTAGGVTKTQTKADTSSQYSVGMFDTDSSKGKSLNAVA